MLEFKKWFLEYFADLDYDVDDKHSILLPTRKTIVHQVAADMRDDFGKLFSKRMGSAMSNKPANYTFSNEDPIKILNDSQYLIVTVDMPITNNTPNKSNLAYLMNEALRLLKSDQAVEQAIQKSRCKVSHIDDISKNMSSRMINKNNQKYVSFTFRFKMNVTLGPGFIADDIKFADDIAISK